MATTVVVVGYCASGKSTLVAGLRERGIDARSVAQEHSIVSGLWKRSEPDVVVFLDVDIEHIRERRCNPSWPEWIRDIQRERLSEARHEADVVIDTSGLSVGEIVEVVLKHLRSG